MIEKIKISVLQISDSISRYNYDKITSTLESMQNQKVSAWELVIPFDEDKKNKNNTEWLVRKDNKVKEVKIKKENEKQKIETMVLKANGEWVGFCNVGDRFASIYVGKCIESIKENSNAKVIYFDDDVLSNNRITKEYKYPFFKPDFSFDYLREKNYIGKSFIIEKDFALKILRRKVKEEKNLNYLLEKTINKVLITTNKRTAVWDKKYPIIHIPQVLRHRLIGEQDSYASEFSQKLEVNEENRTKKVNQIKSINNREPSVTIIIPTKDQFKILEKCINSILLKTEYENYQINIVDNNTTQKKAIKFMQNIEKKNTNIKIYKYNKQFNYSEINNLSVKMTDADIIVFMNNDVEILNRTWLKEMVKITRKDNVGCVGAKLYYPDMTIQHGGVCIGVHGLADHMYKGMKEGRKNDPYGQLNVNRNPLAVTAAVMAIKKSLFVKVSGFDEINLPISFNDVDLCLKVNSLGYRTVWTPKARMIHHESKTRGSAEIKYKMKGSDRTCMIKNERNEITFMQNKWKTIIEKKQISINKRPYMLQII